MSRGFWLLLVLPSCCSGYAATTLVFPHVPVEKGCALLHTPERWAAGAALLASVPPFRIEQVCPCRHCLATLLS